MLTILLATAAACCYALSNVLEQTEAEQMPDELALRPALLIRLAHSRRWVLGFLSDAGGYALYAAALAFGAVVFVQPILSMGLLFSLAFASALGHRAMRRSDWIAAIVLSGGLAVFLLEVSPTGGRDVVTAESWRLAAPLIALIIGCCLLFASRVRARPRAVFLAIAGGIAFGTSAVLTKSFVHFFDDGVFGWVPHWEPYAMAVVTITGFLIAQSSFQVGELAASVAGLETTEPISAIMLGLILLHERIDTSGAGESAIVAVSATAIVLAIISLARSESRVVEETAEVIDLVIEEQLDHHERAR